MRLHKKTYIFSTSFRIKDEFNANIEYTGADTYGVDADDMLNMAYVTCLNVGDKTQFTLSLIDAPESVQNHVVDQIIKMLEAA